jgi:hypothetical protein
VYGLDGLNCGTGFDGALRNGGTASRRDAEYHGCSDCESFAVNLSFHRLRSFFSGVEPKLGHAAAVTAAMVEARYA